MAPREVYGCTKLWRRAGAEVQNFGVWPLGPQPAERGSSGHNKGVPCGARETVTSPAEVVGDWGLTGGHLARNPPRRVVVAEERPGTLGGGLSVVAVRGAAAPAPQAHLTAPYWPRYSLDQRAAAGTLAGSVPPSRTYLGRTPRAPRRDKARLPSTPKG